MLSDITFYMGRWNPQEKKKDQWSGCLQGRPVLSVFSFVQRRQQGFVALCLFFAPSFITIQWPNFGMTTSQSTISQSGTKNRASVLNWCAALLMVSAFPVRFPARDSQRNSVENNMHWVEVSTLHTRKCIFSEELRQYTYLVYLPYLNPPKICKRRDFFIFRE